MSTPYTPGPWKFSQWEQFGDTRFYISQAEGAPYTPHYSDAASLIAETVITELVAIQEANARLIAAAPDLLEALQFFVGHPGVSQLCTPNSIAMTGALAAIAKATGSAS